MKYFFLLPLALALTSYSHAQQIQYDTMLRDLGTMRQLETREATFTVYNTGRDTVRLGDLRAGCGCTQANLSTSILPPGDSARISVMFEAGPYMLGEVRKSVQLGVLDNNSEQQIETLRIRATIVGDVAFEPARISFRITEGETARVTVTLQSHSEEAVSITAIHPELTAFNNSGGETGRMRSEKFTDLETSLSTDVLQPGETGSLDVVFRPQERGQINGFLRVIASDSEIRVPVVGVVLGKQ
ncbi:MAG: DUF1573 domain-containing protein [Bacteroidetes bacterium]|nr:DUF1573 domain-containing protein [Bacteroidota bacterium]